MTKYAVVTTLSTFVIKYVIPMDDLQTLNTDAPVELEWAKDCVTCDEVHEFTQKHIGEQIIDAEEMTSEEVLALHRKEHPASIGWVNDERILQRVKAWKNTDERSFVHNNT